MVTESCHVFIGGKIHLLLCLQIFHYFSDDIMPFYIPYLPVKSCHFTYHIFRFISLELALGEFLVPELVVEFLIKLYFSDLDLM